LSERYGHRLDELRNANKAALERLTKAGADVEKLAAAQAKHLARQNATRYSLMIREFRKELSRLKKNGVLPKEIDVRRATPTTGLIRRLTNLHGVARGYEKTVKLSKAEIARHKQEAARQGVPVVTRGNRLVVEAKPRGGHPGVTRGKGKAAGPTSPWRIKRRIHIGDMDEDELSEAVDEIFDNLKPGEKVSIEIGDNLARNPLGRTPPYLYIFTFGPEERGKFFRKLLDYQGTNTQYVSVVRFADDDSFEDYMGERDFDRDRAQQRRITAAREARDREKVKRISAQRAARRPATVEKMRERAAKARAARAAKRARDGR
jgi:hypothetical protein